MSSWRNFKRPSSGLVVGGVALIVAMTGTAVAASLITSSQIKDGTIQSKDISRKARTALTGKRGPAGPRGLSGAAGAPGKPGIGVRGIPGPVNLTYIQGDTIDNPDLSQDFAEADCPASAPNVVSGGVFSTGLAAENQSVNSSAPIDADLDDVFDGWGVYVNNGPGSDTGPDSVDPDTITAFVVCTTATSVANSKTKTMPKK